RPDDRLSGGGVQPAGTRGIDHDRGDRHAGQKIRERRPRRAAVGGFPDAAAHTAQVPRCRIDKANPANASADVARAEPLPVPYAGVARLEHVVRLLLGLQQCALLDAAVAVQSLLPAELHGLQSARFLAFLLVSVAAAGFHAVTISLAFFLRCAAI